MLLNIFTNKGEKLKSIPDSWDRLTVDQFQRIVKWGQSEKKDPIELFSIVSGIEYDKLFNIRDSDFEEKLFRCTEFVATEPNYSKTPPRSIRLKNKTGTKIAILIPQRTAALSIGQSVLVRQKLDDCRVYEEAISYACAIYLQPLLDRTMFDDERAMIIEQQILKMPAKEIYPLGFFLLSPLMKTGQSFIKGLHLMLARLLRHFITSVKRLLRQQKLNDSNQAETEP